MIIPQQKIFNPLTKINWRKVSDYDTRKLFEPVSIPHEKLGTLNVSIEKLSENSGLNRFKILVKNAVDKYLGIEIFSMHPSDKTITGFNLTVEPEYRRKGYRIGEILRTFSVLEMAENQKSKIEIFSKDTAVYFHSKYKFQPCNHLFKHRNEMLKNIASDEMQGYERFAQRAKELLRIVENPNTTAEEHRELCLKTNELAREYIQASLKELQPDVAHPFHYGFDMVLTKENLMENKEFYNGLFQKYGIDYTI